MRRDCRKVSMQRKRRGRKPYNNGANQSITTDRAPNITATKPTFPVQSKIRQRQDRERMKRWRRTKTFPCDFVRAIFRRKPRWETNSHFSTRRYLDRTLHNRL